MVLVVVLCLRKGCYWILCAIMHIVTRHDRNTKRVESKYETEEFHGENVRKYKMEDLYWLFALRVELEGTA